MQICSPTRNSDGFEPSASRLAAYSRCHAIVIRPVSALRVARAASVQSESPDTTRCTVPAHPVAVGAIAAGAGAAGAAAAVAVVWLVINGALAASGAAVSSLPVIVTSGRKGSIGAWVGTAAPADSDGTV